MANIVLNSKCNLDCTYCFAKGYIKSKNDTFTLENFQKAVNFIKTNKNERIGLVGGEPFLHPQFGEILNILETDNDINNVIIFTNGTCIKRYINKLNNDKFNLLINCNSYKDIGEKYNLLKENLEALNKADIKNITLGINLYSSKEDFTFIFDLLKIINSHKLRFSFSFSKEQKQATKSILDVYKKIKPSWRKFVEECINNEVVPICDCNPMPDCLLDENDRNIIVKVMLLANMYKTGFVLSVVEPCPPLIDIFPDLTAVRSFCYSENESVDISKFTSLSMLRAYFYNQIDIYNELICIDKKCLNCKIRLTGRCRICPIFKIDKNKKLKKLITKHCC